MPDEELDRLRATVNGLDEAGQRNFMRELSMQTHVDFKVHAASAKERLSGVESKVDAICKSLYTGDDTAPGLVKVAQRIMAFLDVCCSIFKWAAGVAAAVAGAIPLYLWWKG